MSEEYDLDSLLSEEQSLKKEITSLGQKFKNHKKWIVFTAIFGGIALFSLLIGITFFYLAGWQTGIEEVFGTTVTDDEIYPKFVTGLVFSIISGASAILLMVSLILLISTINYNKPINQQIRSARTKLNQVQRKLTIARELSDRESDPSKTPERAPRPVATSSRTSKVADPRNISESGDKLIYSNLDGAQRILNVYEDRVVLIQKKNVRAFLTQDLFKGTKEIYYSDMTSVQSKRASKFILGYLQFEVAGLSGNNFASENSWTYEYYNQDKADAALAYIKGRLSEIKKQKHGGGQSTQIIQQASAADEIKKFKELLDQGIITEEEFNQKKKELLGL